MDRGMKRKSNVEMNGFDQAVSDVFQEDPDCEAFSTFDELNRRRFINGMLDAASAVEASSVVQTETRRRKLPLVGAIAAFVAVGIFSGILWSTMGGFSSPKRDTYFGEVREREGNLFFNKEKVSKNAPIPVGKSISTKNGTALLRLPTGIDWWMEKHTEAQIAFLDSDRIQVDIRSGEAWFRVDPTREGPLFSVSTPAGQVDVTGTIFVVNVMPSKSRVTLLRGEVLATPLSGRKDLIREGRTMRLGGGEQHILSTDEKRRMHARLAALSWNTDMPPDVMKSTAEAAGADAKTQISAAPSSPGGGTTSREAPRNLLDEIQNQRDKRNWEKVAHLYKRVIQSAPGSETAVVSRVALGEVYLSKLHRYKDALSQFNRYIHSGHTALLPEASYGKCNALKSLGKRNQEIRCLDRFIRRFAAAFQTPEARARLNALQAEDPR